MRAGIFNRISQVNVSKETCIGQAFDTILPSSVRRIQHVVSASLDVADEVHLRLNFFQKRTSRLPFVARRARASGRFLKLRSNRLILLSGFLPCSDCGQMRLLGVT